MPGAWMHLWHAQHMLEECKANAQIVRKRNKLSNFHVRTHDKKFTTVETLIAQTEQDEGKEKLRTDKNSTWQRRLIPVGMGHVGEKWHHKNNELIFELRKSFVNLVRHMRKPPPKPPPECGGKDGVRKNKRKSSTQTLLSTDKRRRTGAHREKQMKTHACEEP